MTVYNTEGSLIEVNNYISATIAIISRTNYVNYNDVNGNPSTLNTKNLVNLLLSKILKFFDFNIL